MKEIENYVGTLYQSKKLRVQCPRHEQRTSCTLINKAAILKTIKTIN